MENYSNGYINIYRVWLLNVIINEKIDIVFVRYYYVYLLYLICLLKL